MSLKPYHWPKLPLHATGLLSRCPFFESSSQTIKSYKSRVPAMYQRWSSNSFQSHTCSPSHSRNINGSPIFVFVTTSKNYLFLPPKSIMSKISEIDEVTQSNPPNPKVGALEANLDSEKQQQGEEEALNATKRSAYKSLGWLDRFLAVWVLLAMVVGIILGEFVPNTGPALQKSMFVGVSVPIGGCHLAHHKFRGKILMQRQQLGYS